MKNLVQYNRYYSKSVQHTFFYPRTPGIYDLEQYTFTAGVGGAPSTVADNGNFNQGFYGRVQLTHPGKDITGNYYLNRIEFFQSLKDQILPANLYDFKITLDNDNQMIIKDGMAGNAKYHVNEMTIYCMCH